MDFLVHLVELFKFIRKKPKVEKTTNELPSGVDAALEAYSVDQTIFDLLGSYATNVREIALCKLTPIDLIMLGVTSSSARNIALSVIGARKFDIEIWQEEMYFEDKNAAATSTYLKTIDKDRSADFVRFDVLTDELNGLADESMNLFTFMMSPRNQIDRSMFGLESSVKHQRMDSNHVMIQRLASLLYALLINGHVMDIKIEEPVSSDFFCLSAAVLELFAGDSDVSVVADDEDAMINVNSLDIPGNMAPILRYVSPKTLEFNSDMSDFLTPAMLAELPGLVAADEIYWWMSAEAMTDDLMTSLKARRIRGGLNAQWTPLGIAEFIQQWQCGKRRLECVYCSLSVEMDWKMGDFFAQLALSIENAKAVPFSEHIEKRLNYYMEGDYEEVKVMSVKSVDGQSLLLVLKRILVREENRILLGIFVN